MPARYAMINDNGGGLWDTSQMGAESWAIFYAQVDDVHAAIDRAQQLGTSVLVPVIDNGMIEFADLADPLGIWRRKGGNERDGNRRLHHRRPGLARFGRALSAGTRASTNPARTTPRAR